MNAAANFAMPDYSANIYLHNARERAGHAAVIGIEYCGGFRHGRRAASTSLAIFGAVRTHSAALGSRHKTTFSLRGKIVAHHHQMAVEEPCCRFLHSRVGLI